MKLVCLRIIKVLANTGFSTVGGLAKKTGFALSSVSEAVKELEGKSIVSKDNGRIALSSNPFVHELVAVSQRFDVEKLLKDTKEKMLLGLVEPKTDLGLQKSTGLSGVQVSRHLKDFLAIGAVSKMNGEYGLNESIQKFALELKKKADLEGLEPYAVILFSNGVKLVKVPVNASAKGTLTGFSRFAEHGVEYALVNDYFVVPSREVSIEEVFVHALVAIQNKKDLAMCLVFYGKNKGAMELGKIVELSKEFRVLDLFLDCVAFLDRKQPGVPDRFLPWSEFVIIAANYGLKADSVQKFSAKELEALFNEIGNAIKEPLSVFLIGGCNMALQGIKEATKDIDLIVKDKKDFEEIQKAMKKLGFGKLVDIEATYRKMEPSEIFVSGGKPRVDVFTRVVCNAIVLSEGMIDKAIERKYGKLSVNFVRPEDMILFKAITGREGDLDDIAAIIRRQSPDWPFFLGELDRQHGHSERIFCLDVLDTFETLEEREKIVVPVKQKLLELCLEKSILFLAKKPITVKGIMEKIDFPELTIRNKIYKLIKNKKLAKLGGRPFKVQSK